MPRQSDSFATEFPSSPWQVRFKEVTLVHEDSACIYLTGEVLSIYIIISIDSTSESILAIIDHIDSLLVILYFSNGYNGSKAFFLEYTHAIITIDYKSRFKEVA